MLHLSFGAEYEITLRDSFTAINFSLTAFLLQALVRHFAFSHSTTKPLLSSRFFLRSP
jgi:hypothetical protein